MTVQFLKDHVAADGSTHLKGEVATVSEGMGEYLVRAGVAKVRTPPTPKEKK